METVLNVNASTRVANDVVTETELNKIRLVRAFVETQDPSSKVLLTSLILSQVSCFISIK